MKAPSAILSIAFVALALAGCSSTPSAPANEIVAQAEFFENPDRTITVGTTLTFRMVKGSHTVDFAENQAPVSGVSPAHSGNAAPGSTVQVTFTEPGTYPYFCAYHSFVQGGQRAGMIGTITVTA